MFSWLEPKRKPVIVAHRGSSATTPENTLAAFRQAIRDGADAIELDVHLSKDNEVVVIHDATLRRTTSGRGRVRDYTFRELQKFGAGEWFHQRFSSERIPSLREVFEVVPARVGINIELKYTGASGRPDELVKRVVGIVHETRRKESVLISSFHHSSIKKVKQLDSSILTGCLYHPVTGRAHLPVRAVVLSRADVLILSRRYCTRRLVEKAHRHQLTVGEYTIDTKRQIERAMRSGAAVIFTNNPSAILEYLCSLT